MNGQPTSALGRTPPTPSAEARSRSQPDPVDRYAALKLREFRTARGWSQTRLGQVFGCTHQQVHKLESAENRLSAGRLAAAATALGVPVTEFFPPPGEEGGDIPATTDARMRRLLDLMGYARALGRSQIEMLIGIAKATAKAQADLADAQSKAGRYVTEPRPGGIIP